MATKSQLTHPGALMLLLITWRHCRGLAVDPPEDIVVSDPGHLGHLEITWRPPGSLVNMTECSVLYQLEYFNTNRDSWSAIRTKRRTYSAQFDLMKDVRVRVYTLLEGPCTNNTMIMSTNYTELIQSPPSTGVMGTETQDFICVFYNMEYMECTWRQSPKTAANSQQTLYFWHKGLEQAAECPKYILSQGIRSGCDFTGKPLPEFTDINFCVNGSSSEGPLKQTFLSLQIQNHVKPATTEKLHLQTGPGMQLKLHWERPVGRVPGHCLEWEVDHSQDELNGKISLDSIITKQTSLTLPSADDNKRHCFRVRSKLHTYCAEESYWSDWSHVICHPDEVKVAPEPQWGGTRVYIYVAVAIIVLLMVSLCVGGMVRMKKSRQDKKPDSLLTSLFARNSVTAAEV